MGSPVSHIMAMEEVEKRVLLSYNETDVSVFSERKYMRMSII